MTISTCGDGAARWTVSITRFTSPAVNRPDERPARQRLLSIAKASKAPKKGGLDRSARLRCGQEDQRQEAPRAGRHSGSNAACHRSCGRYPGSRRWRLADCNAVRAAPFPDPALCRCRLPRATICQCSEEGNGPNAGRDRQAVRTAPLRGAAQTMAGRAHHRLAQPLPQAGQKLGEPQPNALAFLRLASIRFMLRKLCNPA